jgi:hypothetical protein
MFAARPPIEPQDRAELPFGNQSRKHASRCSGMRYYTRRDSGEIAKLKAAWMASVNFFREQFPLMMEFHEA